MLGLGLSLGGCSSGPPPLPTTFGPFPSSPDVSLLPGRDLQPGLYRTTPVGGQWCKIESPTTPHAGTKEYAPDRKQYVGPDGQFTFVMVPVQGTEFVVRNGAPISASGPCV